MASNRLRAVNAAKQEEGKMDMSPMIDMVFLLLLFFLVVSNPKTIKK
jgi:biopolymer transport protein ExbD